MPAWLLWLVEGAGTLLRALFTKPAPTVADEAARAASVETQLHEEQAADAVTTKAADARGGAGDVVMHDLSTSDILGTTAALKQHFPGDFRD